MNIHLHAHCTFVYGLAICEIALLPLLTWTDFSWTWLFITDMLCEKGCVSATLAVTWP